MTVSVVSRRVSPLARSVVLAAALLLLGLAGASAHSDHAKAGPFSYGEPGKAAKVDRTVKITMREMSFEPASLRVKAGETIRFVVTNRSEVDHDFTIGDEAAQTAHRQEMLEMMEKGGEMNHHDDANAIAVKAGQTGKLIWKFSRPGTFAFDCNVPGHYEAGMAGAIVVAGKAGAAPTAAPHTDADMPDMPGMPGMK
jgi:uncharacterized cupredoxin-like copper-binding protein